MKSNKFKSITSFEVPEEYSHISMLPKVDNQNHTHMCIPYALSACLNWNINVNNGECKDNHIDVNRIYSHRKFPGDNGMSFEYAFDFLINKGVKYDYGTIKINDYLLIEDILSLKQAILLNGPCIAAIKYKNKTSDKFWEGINNFGGHVVAIVGYNKEGFIIRNSWGKEYGSNGYCIFPYNKFSNIIECYTIIIN